MRLWNATLVFLCIASVAWTHCDAEEHTWDYLIFTQTWPASRCHDWKQKEPSHTCNYPRDRSIWTVHGIWPSRNNSEGPFFCNSSAYFNFSAIQPLRHDLLDYWTNVENGTKPDSLWRHEWLKHGTCASLLPQLDGEYEYFSQGLKWLQQYQAEGMMTRAGFVPDDSKAYSVRQVWSALKSFLGAAPMLFCDEYNGKRFYLTEVRLCFDKKLQLMDCDHRRPVHRRSSTYPFSSGGAADDPITNCDIDTPLIYPSAAVSKVSDKQLSLASHYLEMYKLTTFLIWATL